MTLGTSKSPRRLTVLIAKGSVVNIEFVALKAFARPPGPIFPSFVKISGRVGTMVTQLFISTPLLLIAIGNTVPLVALAIAGGTTNSTLLPPTDLRPHATPSIVTETPLNSIGSVNARVNEPAAVLGVIGVSVAVYSMIATMPGEIPSTAAGVTGVGVGVGDPVGVGLGVGVGVGVAVGVGVGVTEGVGVGLAVNRIGSLLAPVKKFVATVVWLTTVG